MVKISSSKERHLGLKGVHSDRKTYCLEEIVKYITSKRLAREISDTKKTFSEKIR